MNNYPRGSEWRKWDLHVHTPLSLVNHFNGANEEEKWENFIKDLEQLPEEFKVIGINDYLFVDGYKKVLEYKKLGRLNNIELFLPVVEFRIKKFAGHRNFKRINFHVIFSNQLEPDVIESQFLNALKSKYKLSPGLDGNLWNGTITKESLEELGKKIKQNIPPGELGKYGSDLEEGFNNLNLDEEDILEILSNNTFLKDKYLTAIGKTEWESLSWNDQSIAEKKDIINKVDLVFIASDNVNSYKKAKNKLKEQKVNDLLLDCSDAHYNFNSENKDRIGNCFTWIKADPTFEGLKQIIYESEERVKIQEEKPEQKEPYNLIDYVQFIDSNGDFTGEKILLNQNLNVIIGGKSTGKSILLREIARTINPKEVENRLKEAELKDYTKIAGKDFIVKWVDDNGEDKRSERRENHRKIIYIPQSYLNRLADEQEEQSPIDKLVENILKNDAEVKHFFKELNNKVNENNRKISNEIENLFENLQRYEEKNAEIKDLGDKKGIESYIKNIEEKIKILQKKGGLNEKEIREYNSLKEEYEKLQKQLQDYREKKQDFERIEESKKFTFSYELEQIIDKYKNLKDKARYILNKAEIDFNFYLKNKITYIEKQIEKTENELENMNKKIEPLLEKVKNMDLISDKNKKLINEKNKLKQIIKKEEELNEIKENIDESVNKLANYFVNYYNIKNKFKSSLKEVNSLGNDLELEIIINAKNNEFNRDFIEEIFNLVSLPEKYKDFKFNLNDIENLKILSNICCKIPLVSLSS